MPKRKQRSAGSRRRERLTCTECAYKNRCMGRSRNYACNQFKPKEGVLEGQTNIYDYLGG